MDNVFQQIWDRILAVIAPKPMSDADLEKEFDKQAKDYQAENGVALNWRVSVVDFLTLLGIDSSAANRDALAEELFVIQGESGSAERNEYLRRAIFEKIAANGGNVPQSLRD